VSNEAFPSISGLFRNSVKNWGRWGPDDEIGAINFLTPAEAVRGARSVRSGKTFALSLEILSPRGDPVTGIRPRPQKFMTADKGLFMNGLVQAMPGDQEYSDDIITMYLQGSTQMDALGHVWYDDTLYNGYPASSTIGTLTKNSIRPIAEHGVVGRGVLLDVARYRGVKHLETDQITLDELLAVAAKQGITLEKHDILLIRTGRMAMLYDEGMDAFWGPEGEAGITDEPAMIAFFHEMEFPTFGTDTLASEQTISSISGGYLPLHAAFLTNLGIPFMEMLWLDDLAADCAADGQYDFQFVTSPLKVCGGAGSPINPLAIK
jgi:kynurenine formamidase